MCGIAGIVSADHNQVSLDRLKQMTDAIRHRGPEGDGFWRNESQTAGFGHRRLSIIDLSDSGKQPMHYVDRYTITYNGEIYNYLELKDELQRKGYQFKSQSDTEVILAAFACYQEDCLRHFDGMFSFVIWDREEHRLFAARDRFGEKPFYYSWDPISTSFLFASEMKALWKAGVPKVVNPAGMLDFLTLGHVQPGSSPSDGFFQGIRSLPPSHYLLFDLKAGWLKEMKYYRLDPSRQLESAPIKVYAEKFISCFNRSVARRLRSDVPVGTSLSGGLDSSSIAAVITQLQGVKGSLHTFSAVFPGFEKDESEHIKLICEKFRLINHSVVPSAEGMVKDFETLCYHQEEPFASASIYAQYKVFELARQHDITVLLDGQGADEMLAGYSKYIHWHLQEVVRGNTRGHLKEQLHDLRWNALPFSWTWKNYLAAWFPARAAKQLEAREYQKQKRHRFITDAFYKAYVDRHRIVKPVIKNLNDILYYNTFHLGLQELLRYADRNSMAHGREVRLPFLRHELVELIFGMPSSAKINNGFTKYVLRRAMADSLPETVTWRTDKIGYEPPQKQWMQHPVLQDYIHEAKKGLVQHGILRPEVLKTKVQPQDAHAADNFDWRYMIAEKVMR